MTNEEYQHTQNMLMMAATIVSSLDLEAFRSRINHAESVCPIIHPTLYRDGEKRLEAIANLAYSAQTFKYAFEKLNEVVASEPTKLALVSPKLTEIFEP